MRSAAVLTLLALPLPASAGSIAAPGVIAGPDSSAATPNPAALHYNPAAIAATEGLDALLDAHAALVRVDIEATRNDGIDPNTDEPYAPAQARVVVPVGFLGVTWKAIPDRLAVGLAATDAFVGGGDYTAGEPDADPPYVGHQRYFGVKTTVLTLHAILGAGLTVLDGVHVGAAGKWIVDSIQVTQAADTLGSEGVSADGPYTADTLLVLDASGGHPGYGLGLYVDRLEPVRVGVSWTRNGTFSAEGTAEVTMPGFLGGASASGDAAVAFPLPDVVHAWVDVDLSERLTVGAGAELQMWGACCGGRDGDIRIDIENADGEPLGPDDGLPFEVSTPQYAPRRLENALNLGANAGWDATDRLWLGGRLSYNQAAVPDFAVTATNLDYDNVGVQLAARWRLRRAVVGLHYTKYLLFERTITDSAYGDDSGPYADDERFNPSDPPFKVSANGTYHTDADLVGLRVSWGL